MKGIISLSNVELKLVQVQVFYRHGARTPLHYVKSQLADAKWTPDTTKDVPKTLIPMVHLDFFDSKPVDESTFDLGYRPVKLPGGEAVGMLTAQGQKDLYDYGVFLRREYAGEGGIISDPPKLSEIEARSTRIGRNIKSTRSLVAGLTGGQIDYPLVVRSMNLDVEVLFPNPKISVDTAFEEGTEELRNDASLLALKNKIRKALEVDFLVDELEQDEAKYTRDCQVYYVRDDYAARKHNGFPIPRGLDELELEIDHYAAVELTNELLGRHEDWKKKLDVSIGPVFHLILSKMRQHQQIPPMQLVAVHDSTILPMLIALDSCNEMWPPFGADIRLELYTQVSGPAYKPPHAYHFSPAARNSSIDWTGSGAERMWVRVLYLGRPLPLASLWCSGAEGAQHLTGSDDYVPLLEFVRHLTPIVLSPEDYRAKCKSIENALKATRGKSQTSPKGPKNI